MEDLKVNYVVYYFALNVSHRSIPLEQFTALCIELYKVINVVSENVLK